MDGAQPTAINANSPSRPKRRRWPAVLFWVSVILLALHVGLLIFVYSHLGAWLEPLSYLLVIPTGLLLLVGVPIIALALLCHLVLTYRSASSQKRSLLILQIVVLIALRAGLHFAPGGILCTPIEAFGFRLGDGPRLQSWVQSVLANPVKAGIEKSQYGFPGETPGYAGDLPPNRLPVWILRLHPNIAAADLRPGNQSVAIGVEGGFGEWELDVGQSNLTVPNTDPNDEFRATKLWPGMYYCEGG